MDKNFQKLWKDFLDNNTHIYKQTISTPKKKKKTKSASSIFKTAAQKTPVIKKSQRLGKILSRCKYYNLHYPEFKELSQLSSKKTYPKRQKSTTPTNNLKIGNQL